MKFKKYIPDNKWLLIILFAALVLRLGSFIGAKPWEESYMQEKATYADAGDYQSLALKILETGSYPEHMFLDTFRTPVFPVYVALFYYIFGVNPYIILLSNIILALISIYFIYLLCIRIFDNKVIALISSALFALEPNLIKLITEFGTENLHSALLLISVYFLITGLQEKRKLYFLLSPVLFVITALTRPINLYFYILCIIFILFFPGELLKKKFKTAVLFLVIYFISIAPWMLRNYIVYDHFSANTQRGLAFIYHAGITKTKVTGSGLDAALAGFVAESKSICEKNNITNPFEVDKQTEIVGLNYLYSQLDTYIYLQVKGMLNFFIAPLNNPNYSLKSKIPVGIYLSAIYFLTLFGIYRMIKDGKGFYAVSLMALVFYFCFLTGIIGLARYRMPTTPFYLIIASYGIYYLINFFREKVNIKHK